MAIQVSCTGCGKHFRAKDQFRGTKVKCPNCKTPLIAQGPHVCGSDVFISHSTHDKQVADAVCAAMEGKHVKCWMAPRDIPAGVSWGAAIVEGIEDSRLMLLVFSEHANGSDQVLREVERAVAKKKPVVPLRIDQHPMRKDFEYFLASSQWIDATEGALEEHLAKLTSTVRHLLLDRAEAEADAPAAVKAVDVPASVSAAVPSSAPTPSRAPLIIAGVVLLAVLAGVLVFAIKRGSSNAGASTTTTSTGTTGAQTLPSTTGPSDNSIDLLAKVKLPDDVVSGQWTRTAEGGLHAAGAAPGRIRFGPPPGGDYDLYVELTPTVGEDDVGLVLSRFGQNFVFFMGGKHGPEYQFTRKRKAGPGGQKLWNASIFRNDVRHTIIIRVRKSGLVAIVDGVRVKEMRTDYEDLTMEPRWTIGRNSLGIVTYRITTIHSAKLVPVPEGADDKQP